MHIISKDIENRFKVLSLYTNDLFSDKENLEILTHKIPENKQDCNDENYDNLLSQIPAGIYKHINDLVESIKMKYDSDISKNVTYSPMIASHKAFDACKKISYSHGNIITGREKEIDQIMMTLSRRNKRGVIIVGHAGTGKTAIVNELNTKLINGTVPFPLKNCKIHNLDIPWIFTHYPQDPISKIVDILETASKDPKHILFIDEVHQLLNEKFNDILKPYLTGEIRFIGATTVDEYHNIVTEDKAIERRFTLVHVDEPSVLSTTDMVVNTKMVYEDYHNCSIPNDICKYLVENGSRFLGHRKNPDKSFDILDKACSIMNIKDIKEIDKGLTTKDHLKSLSRDIYKLKNYELTSGKRVLTERHINLAISDIGNIDYDYIKNSLDFKHIVKTMNKEIVNQTHAVDELANIANIMKHVNINRTRPVSIALLVGAHGVGKSKSVNMLSNLLFGNENIIEYDLGQYTQEFQLTELKGAPPGYVGYQKSGKLIKDLRNNPQSVLYLKHINKCHTSIADYLLTSIRNGKLIDSAEREVSLNNTIIIFSVSLDESENKTLQTKTMGFSETANGSSDIDLDKIINKNILNAVDITIKFNDLTDDDLTKIYDMNVDESINIYNDVHIDKTILKDEVFKEECKNGHDVISRLTSVVPKLIFNEIKEEDAK